jgi:hypothetical protein
MERKIPESDWKRWRKLSRDLLERFSSETLAGVNSLCEGKGSAHQRYLELWEYLRDRDQTLSAIFDDQRRSTAFFQIARASEEGLLTAEELEGFTAETQEVIKLIGSL